MQTTNTPEQLYKLLAHSGQGDREAFHALYEATSAKLFGLCRSEERRVGKEC